MENNNAVSSFSKIASKICHEIFFLALSALLLGIFAESLLPGLLNDKKVFSALIAVVFASAAAIIRFSPKRAANEPDAKQPENEKPVSNRFFKIFFYPTAIFLAASSIVISLRRFGWPTIIIFPAFIWITVLFKRIFDRE